MKISELPADIRAKAEEYRRLNAEKRYDGVLKEQKLREDKLGAAFTWKNTEEGHNYWQELDCIHTLINNTYNII